ncbi:MAG: hypothetical protein BWZ02_01497 [Lentisphaerae bacterium ADurb.BinA184]|nr:MAG: hypothetical protein BWZ02_01497 [Lentisphaerae bacterium ADurb.BinA184]
MTPAPGDCRIQLDVISEGYDRRSEWFQPRIGLIPPATAVLTMTRALLWGSDVFTAVCIATSGDAGRTWTPPAPCPELDRRRLADGTEVCPCDMTPAWHAPSRCLLATGHTATYHPGPTGGLRIGNSHPRDVAYASLDPATGRWDDWQTLAVPDRDAFYWCSAGCAQRLDLPGGDVLLPVSIMDRASVGDNSWHGCFATRVARCVYDGRTLSAVEFGDALTVAEPRGLYEPSLALFQGRFFLTLRNDLRGYVAVGRDGLRFGRPQPWRFDTGEELGSYNTQQHWIARDDRLFLVYTRRGAENDHVFRHRAPLFMAEVDTERLCVRRDTEQILVPERGAQLGNFGVVNVDAGEAWVVTSEGMQGDARNPMDVTLAERRGADNRVYLCRLRWPPSPAAP